MGTAFCSLRILGYPARVSSAASASSVRTVLHGPAILAAIALAGLAGLAGCAAPTVTLQEGAREYVATDYDAVLDRWTRTERLFSLSELETHLTVTATFESYDFRWAYVVRYAQDYRITIDQRKKLLEKALDESRRQHHFFVALYGGERRYNDLTKPNSAWIVRLIDDTGNETAPQEIIAVKKPNAIERNYFPYNTSFRQAFRLRFPRVTPEGSPTISPQARWVGLRFAGAQGASELVWKLEEPGKRKVAGDDAIVVAPVY